MLRPRVVQATLQALLEEPGVPADTALVVFSDSGTIYSQAHSIDFSQVASSSTLQAVPKQRLTDSQRLQYLRQPGLSSLLGTSKTPHNQNSTKIIEENVDEVTSLPSTSATMELTLQTDERAKILAALACQSWQEETNRVRRLFSKIHGHQAAVVMSETSDRMRSFSASTGNGGGGGSGSTSGKNGVVSKRRVEQSALHRSIANLSPSEEHLEQGLAEQIEEQESVAASFAVPGTLLNIGTTAQSVAPLLLEGGLGALLIMPLHHLAMSSNPSSPSLPQSSPPLLLVLSSGTHSANGLLERTLPGSGTSLLSQQQWNDLNNAASTFTSHVSLPLRKAFGREERDVAGYAATLSDVESSVDFEGLAVGTGTGTGIDGQVGINVR